MITKHSLLKELAKRKKESPESNPLILADFLFEKQLKFVQDESPFKVAVCSRRAGKSTSVAGDLVATAYSTPECTALYITGTRTDAKKIIWAEALKFNRKHNLGGVANISELTISFPNGSIVRLAGAKDEQEIEKIRGQLPPVKKVFIDECQSIRDRVLVKLIDDVLEASLLDFAGSICLLGTPGPVKAGYFYRMSHNLDEDSRPLADSVWSVHGWTFFDNPHIPLKSKTTHNALLDRTLKRRGVSIDHPSIQREFFGRWEADTDSLLIHYNQQKNDFIHLPPTDEFGTPIKYNYILGIDVGYMDADAIAVLAWSDKNPNVYLVEEKVVRKQDITDLVNLINQTASNYDVTKFVMDAGALGKKIQEEIIRRYGVPVEAADKTRKMENIALLNDFLRSGRFRAKPGSKFAQDSYLVEIDRDKSTPDRIAVSTRYHSDIIDAVLYAFKESYAYAYQKPKEPIKVGSKEWYKAERDKMFQRSLQDVEQGKQKEEDDEWWKDYV
jgi:hypothetical protein